MPVETDRIESVAVPAWSALAVATAGLAHLESEPPLPCQDAAGVATEPRPVLVVADGLGCSP